MTDSRRICPPKLIDAIEPHFSARCTRHGDSSSAYFRAQGTVIR
jgi:hypothetical protein